MDLRISPTVSFLNIMFLIVSGGAAAHAQL